MLSEEVHAGGVAEDKLAGHEAAAHEKRNWVRLTFDCNNKCIFCLDSDTHDGEMRDRDDVKRQILDGRKKGATRLILSGGEPTIHPNYVDFVKLGHLAGYTKVQTVTNGRLFSYPDFLGKCLDAGLSEITFSLHGPNAKIHDALVGVKGAFEQEVAGLQAAIADGRPIVNVDVVINRANVKHLSEMLDKFIAMGVREFDLLQVVPFGRAYTDGRDTLFYDLEEARPYLLAAFAYSRRPDLHIWLNRFPPQHLEGYEHLIQDPYKLNDEVRGRKEEFARLLDEGVALDCRAPERCRTCYLERLCDTLDDVRGTVATRRFDVVRVDTEWQAQQPPVFGGDPASARRALAEAAGRAASGAARSASMTAGAASTPGSPVTAGAASTPGSPASPGAASTAGSPASPGAASTPGASGRPPGRLALPILGQGRATSAAEVATVEELVAEAHPGLLWLRAPDLARAAVAAARFPAVPAVELELDDASGLGAALAPDGRLWGRRLHGVVAHTGALAQTLLALPGDFRVVVHLSRDTEAFLLGLQAAPARLVIRQPRHERLTEAALHDVDLPAFFRAFRHPSVPVEGVPACVVGRSVLPAPALFDTAMLDEQGRLEVFRYTRRFIVDRYMTKSLRCKDCALDAGCAGIHVNHVRARGYGLLSPLPASALAEPRPEAAE